MQQRDSVATRSKLKKKQQHPIFGRNEGFFVSDDIFYLPFAVVKNLLLEHFSIICYTIWRINDGWLIINQNLCVINFIAFSNKQLNLIIHKSDYLIWKQHLKQKHNCQKSCKKILARFDSKYQKEKQLTLVELHWERWLGRCSMSCSYWKISCTIFLTRFSNESSDLSHFHHITEIVRFRERIMRTMNRFIKDRARCFRNLLYLLFRD